MTSRRNDANPYSVTIETIITSTLKIAHKYNHGALVVEHLFAAILDHEEGRVLLNHIGDTDAMAQEVHKFLQNTTGLERNAQQNDGLTQATPAFNRILLRAQKGATKQQRMMQIEDLLVAMFEEKDGHAAYFMKNQGITPEQILGSPIKSPEGAKAKDEFPFLTDLNAMAQAGKIDAVVGRREEIERVSEILLQRRKNNPVLVGEAGVGKTAIAEGLALRIVEGRVPEALKEARIFSMDLTGMLAGAKYRGDFEDRLKKTIETLESVPHSIVFIDELHTMVGAGGSGRSDTMDASNILKPALARGTLRLMGATTFQEWRLHIEKDAALARRFQKVSVGEPSVAESIEILKHMKGAYEAHHQTSIDDAAIQAAVELSARYIPSRRLPDKAFDVIDSAGARWRLMDASLRKACVDKALVEEVVVKIAGLAKAPSSAQESQDLEHLEDHMRQDVFGQDAALEVLTTAVHISQAGIREDHKPVGSYLFYGPTGVGKTETAKSLAKHLNLPLLRFDMSEYMEKHSVARLIGAPPGYVGFDQAGLLTEAVSRTPSAVVLIDEVEKAHPDLQSLFLQIMDHGKLTDSNGKSVPFNGVVLIFTTNAGVAESKKATIGFGRTTEAQAGEALAAIHRQFSPEFRNRLDALVPYSALDMHGILRVVDKMTAQLEEQVAKKNVQIALSPEARLYLGQVGFDPEYGARPMGRAIADRIKKPLAKLMLFGALKEGGVATIDLVNGVLEVSGKPRTQPKAAALSA